jgi:flagellar hook-associated protein FlgK
MAEDKIDSLFDFQKLEQEKARLIGLLKEIAEHATKINESFGNTKGVAEMQKQLQELTQEIERQKKINKELIDVEKAKKQQLDELSKTIERNTQAVKTEGDTYASIKKRLQEVTEEIIANQREVTKLTNANKTAIKEEKAGTVAVKTRGDSKIVEKKLDEFVGELKELIKERK